MKYKYYLKKTIKLFGADDIIFYMKKKIMRAHMYART